MAAKFLEDEKDLEAQLENVCKWYGADQVLKGASLSVRRGEVTTIVGPSGSGKSTLLRCINGLTNFDTGRMTVVGETVEGGVDERGAAYRRKSRSFLKIRQKVGMVFQQYNLFPHLTVLENVTLGPIETLRVPAARAREEALGFLDSVGLKHKKDSYPEQLSGGQQQRVAIARSLAMRPRLMLMDEITAALDPELVGEVLHVVKNLVNAEQTMVLVTHELDFAREISDHVVMMDAGCIIEEGPPEQVLQSPQTDRAKKFLSAVINRHHAFESQDENA